MTVSEAIAVNAVVSALIVAWRPQAKSAEADAAVNALREHAVLLAEHAHKTLKAGIACAEVKHLWPV